MVQGHRERPTLGKLEASVSIQAQLNGCPAQQHMNKRKGL